MKQIRTLRGVVNASSKKRIFNNDLRNVGWKVTAFHYWPNQMDNNANVWGKLWIGNDLGGSLSFSDAQDNRCIGWAAAGGGQLAPSPNPATRWSLIDPDHVVTNTLTVINGAASAGAYLIELELMTLSDDQEIMALIKERSQDDI